jgi:hypothetical protein
MALHITGHAEMFPAARVCTGESWRVVIGIYGHPGVMISLLTLFSSVRQGMVLK